MRLGFNQYKPDDNRALAVFDDKFDLYPEKNQIAFQKLCDYVENLSAKIAMESTWMDVWIKRATNYSVAGHWYVSSKNFAIGIGINITVYQATQAVSARGFYLD